VFRSEVPIWQSLLSNNIVRIVLRLSREPSPRWFGSSEEYLEIRSDPKSSR